MPKVPQRTSWVSCWTLCENQRLVSFMDFTRSASVLRQNWIRPQKCSVNSSTSCSGKSASTFWRTASRGRVAAEELAGHLVEVAQVLVAELLEALALEALAGDAAVRAQPLAIGQVRVGTSK